MEWTSCLEENIEIVSVFANMCSAEYISQELVVQNKITSDNLNLEKLHISSTYL